MIYLLDTDHVSELQGIAVAGRRLTARLGRIAPDDYGTTIITFEEQIRGRLAQAAASKATTAASSVNFYALLMERCGFTTTSPFGSIRKRQRSGMKRCGLQKSG